MAQKNILLEAAQRQAAFAQTMEYLNGYETKTTFYGDFTIAEIDGPAGVRETYERVFAAWRDNCEYWTELVLSLNHKIWQHYGRGPEDPEYNAAFVDAYNEIWQKAEEWAAEHFKGAELDYFYRITD